MFYTNIVAGSGKGKPRAVSTGRRRQKIVFSFEIQLITVGLLKD
jgi:hypothetical protein